MSIQVYENSNYNFTNNITNNNNQQYKSSSNDYKDYNITITEVNDGYNHVPKNST